MEDKFSQKIGRYGKFENLPYNEKRGQAAFELVVVFAVALTMVVAFILAAQMGAADVNKAIVSKEAKNTMADLSAAAKEVYAHGSGSKKLVYVTMPSGIDAANTKVEDTSIRMRVSGTDYTEIENFNVHGSLPGQAGNYWLWVISEGNKVRIGYAMIGLSRQMIQVSMEPNSTASQNFEVQNLWNGPINVTAAGQWNHPETTFGLSGSPALLGLNGTKTMTATFTTTEKATGLYLSELELEAVDGGGNKEAINMPVLLEVVSDPNVRPPLTVTPPMFNATLNKTNTTTKAFQVCTNEVTSVTGITFTPSSGAPGAWISGTSALGPLGADSCTEKLLTLTVPGDASNGNYTGYISVLGQGVAAADDSIALQITVGGAADNVGPDVRNITTAKRRVHTWEPVTIVAVADDNQTGNSRIKSCAIKFDNQSAWSYMFPVDGTFDSSVESVSFTHFDGFGWGPHTAFLRCMDAYDNIGPTKNYSIKIARNILFVIAAGNETEWGNWIMTHWSSSGHPWDYSTATTAQVESGAVDLTYYDVVIFIDWSNGMASIVNDYRNRGGYLGLFGESAHLAVVDLGIAWHPDNPHPEKEINIINNSHYVTNGFALGLLQITTVATKTYEVRWDENSTKLASSGWFYPATDRVVLAEVNRTVLWGVEDPWRLNANGVLISQRVIDWMINQSLVN